MTLVAEEMQSSDGKALFMRQYYDQGLYRYKYLGLQKKKPTIVALGTSRTMQFRAEMFGRYGKEFYNAGGMIQHLRDLEEFAQSVPGNTNIRTIFLGVEFWWLLDSFASASEKNKYYSREIYKDDALDGIAHASLFQGMIRGSLGLPSSKHPTFGDVTMAYSTPMIQTAQRIGWYAKKKNAGFRADGSFDYGQPFSSKYVFVDQENVVERIKKVSWGGGIGQEISTRYLKKLLVSLNLLRDMGIEVICFLPPFASEVLEALRESDRYGKAWEQYVTDVPTILQQAGFVVVNATSTGTFGLDDRCMIDGLHAMETFHVKLLSHIEQCIASGSTGWVDDGYLQTSLDNPRTNLWFPRYKITNLNPRTGSGENRTRGLQPKKE